VAERVVGTGIELSLVSADAYNALERGSVPGDFAIEAQLFTDVDDDGRRYRVGGSTVRSGGWGYCQPVLTPRRCWSRSRKEMREDSGDLLGDMKRGGCDLTRFEFYASPFHIELDEALQEALRSGGKSARRARASKPR
jgi:hypothetical protein